MRLKLLRNRYNEEWTTGQLYLEDTYFCFTLEDEVREDEGTPVKEWKVDHETAIPRGIYKVTLETSPRFGPNTITIHNVPGFSGVRFHSGNTEKDTDGCIIVGYRIIDGGIIVPGTTRTCLADLKRILMREPEHTIQVI